MLVRTSVESGSYPWHVFQRPDMKRTIMQALCYVLLELLALNASILLLQCNLQRPGIGLCHDPEFCISSTIPPRVPLVKPSCPNLDFESQGTDSLVANGSTELLD